MKEPAFSAPPLSGEPETKKLSFRELLLGERRKDRYYEAEDPGHTVCLLWMEGTRFGTLRAYPCLVWEEGAEPLRFDSSPTVEAGENNSRLMARWELCTAPERLAELEIRPLELEAFRAKLRSFPGLPEPI